MLGQVVAFVSGKGGTGKTTLSAAVAGFLAKCGRSVLCMDLDVGLRNLDISLGMRDEATVSFLDAMDGHCSLSAAPVHPLLPSLRVLTAPVTEPDAVDERGFFSLLDQAKHQFDWVILDAPAGLGHIFRLAVRRAAKVLVVTQADPACLRDAQIAATISKELGSGWVRVVINRVDARLYHRMRTNVDDMMDAVGLSLIGLVPEHIDVLLASVWGTPLCNVPGCPASVACCNIASRLEGENVPLYLR